jgi:hypothetical protein
MVRAMRTMLALGAATVVAAAAAFAQNGTIFGALHDEKSGEELVGANVILGGTRLGASTDIDGKFTVRNVPPGTYDVRATYVGYSAKTVTGVVVKPGESVKLDISLAEETFQAEEVTVTAERMLNTEAAVLSERKKAATIGDGVSAEQVKKTPDVTSGDALKRVTGISVVDNKFVYVRGVTDRYNATTLNGVTTTSTEVGKKSFTYDLLPANLLENTTVVKSATPDLAGDFTGGLVQLNTLDFPDRRTLKLTLRSGYNDITTGENFLASQGGGRDWLAADDGTRAYPGDPTNQWDVAQQLPNNWAPKRESAPINGGFALSYGDRWLLGEETADQLGVIGALSYQNGFQRAEVSTNYVSEGGDPLVFSGTNNTYGVLWGGILDVNTKVGGLHKFSFKNSYNRLADDRVNAADGYDSNGDVRRLTTEWSERSTYATSLGGQHTLPSLGDLGVQWKGYYNESRRDEPDRKSLEYSRPTNSPDLPYEARPGERSWANFFERLNGASADVTIPVGQIRVKTGGLVEGRDRHYGIRYYQMDHNNLSAQNYHLTGLSPDSIYSPENFGPGKFGMNLVSNSWDEYTADQTLYAFYGMADVPFSVAGEEFRLVGGARMENSTQNVQTTEAPGSATIVNAQLKRVDILPSLNLTWLVNDATNVRLAYSHSVNRPEFREMASVYIYDFDTYEGLQGNPGLQRAYVRNYDARFEVFPGIGELVAVSFFYKSITGAIEEQLIPSSKPLRTWFNSDRGKNYGWEFEVRKDLGFLGDYGRNFSVTGNYTRIMSEIEYTVPITDPNNQGNVVGEQVLTRPMQGQSPYMINLSFSFTEPTIGTSVNVLYNTFGSRLDAVGYNDADTYEQPRDVVDLALTQPIVSSLEVKFAVRDLLAEEQRYTRRELDYRTYLRGTNYSLTLSMAF